MSKFQELKRELSILDKTFGPRHEHFRVEAHGLDEVTYRFIAPDGEHIVHCNISESYPSPPPMWFSESEDAKITQIVESLSCIEPTSPNLLLRSTKHLIKELCKWQNISLPPYVDSLDLVQLIQEDVEMKDCALSQDDDESEDEGLEEGHEDSEDSDNYEMEEDMEQDSNKEVQEIGAANYAVLERIRVNRREDHLKGTVCGSVQATDRLMKELRDVYRSDSFKKGTYSVCLNNDNLYDWTIKIMRVDPDSTLHRDLMQLKGQEGTDHVLLNMTFTEKFPFDPPFVRVVYPVLTAGYVLSGGALCMELLTPQGWSSAYTIEAVIVQIAATLVKGKARINFQDNKKQGVYSLVRAQQSFRSLVQIHEKNGWYTPPKHEG
ncbi:PREDICTED: ubiquitin-conjugating enzyme E2 Q1-like [Acropora digitifera]|uniref:ubiquitin-conjugating enzyme E2 Q1-like n=1 Tax=Acropora digitifera TaxID=70779 RepID=UPI00077B0185|nr:PREDICTED: ubiquitin-conjugating enzyme E2 Q1-like [Acropora digitifera]